jgi:hypothetical protein
MFRDDEFFTSGSFGSETAVLVPDAPWAQDELSPELADEQEQAAAEWPDCSGALGLRAAARRRGREEDEQTEGDDDFFEFDDDEADEEDDDFYDDDFDEDEEDDDDLDSLEGEEDE